MSIPTSLELWASSKIIGRECALVNKDFFLCKKSQGPEPQKCDAQSASVTNCATKIVTTLNAEYPKEFAAFQKCLDYNDYRFNDCRKTERALLDSWNVKMGYAVAQSE